MKLMSLIQKNYTRSGRETLRFKVGTGLETVTFTCLNLIKKTGIDVQCVCLSQTETGLVKATFVSNLIVLVLNTWTGGQDTPIMPVQKLLQ
jgi:hypothetical protein